MTTYLASRPSTDLTKGPLPIETLTRLRGQTRYLFHDLVLREFVQQEESGAITRTDLAVRIHKRKEQLTRWLGAPGNIESDTLSDLLAGLGLRIVSVVLGDMSEHVRPSILTDVFVFGRTSQEDHTTTPLPPFPKDTELSPADPYTTLMHNLLSNATRSGNQQEPIRTQTFVPHDVAAAA